MFHNVQNQIWPNRHQYLVFITICKARLTNPPSLGYSISPSALNINMNLWCVCFLSLLYVSLTSHSPSSPPSLNSLRLVAYSSHTVCELSLQTVLRDLWDARITVNHAAGRLQPRAHRLTPSVFSGWIAVQHNAYIQYLSAGILLYS